MSVADRIKCCVSTDVQNYIDKEFNEIREIRMRTGQPVQIISKKDRLVGEPVKSETIKEILAVLTDYSLYTKERELSEGFFTLQDGSRVGVCGKIVFDNDRIQRMTHISSLSIRIARVCNGCSDPLMDQIISEGRIESTIIFSPPGFGKTTLLRDIARELSERGFCVGIADERHEITASVQGVPSVDVGSRTDVLDGCPKSIAVYLMIRAMSPQIIITDEIGDANDAAALSDAARCGIGVIASAHSGSLEELMERKMLSELMNSGVFQVAVQLGEVPGKIISVWKYKAGHCGGVSQWVRV